MGGGRLGPEAGRQKEWRGLRVSRAHGMPFKSTRLSTRSTCMDSLLSPGQPAAFRGQMTYPWTLGWERIWGVSRPFCFWSPGHHLLRYPPASQRCSLRSVMGEVLPRHPRLEAMANPSLLNKTR